MPPINVPTIPQEEPFLSGQPVAQWWDNSSFEWKNFDIGRMYVDRLNLRLLNQGLSEATLRYECGEISFEGTIFTPVLPLTLDRTWIRIVFVTDDTAIVEDNLQPDPKTIWWAGIVVETSEDNRARDPGPGHLGFRPRFDTGPHIMTQRFTLRGMEWLMARRQIVSSSVWANVIQHGLAFNYHGDEKIGRQTVKGNKLQNGFGFADRDSEAEVWTGEQIVDYLILTAFPVGDWNVAASNISLLQWVKPVIQTHGRTLYDIFRALASPRRGLDSYVIYAPGANDSDFGTFTYRVESMFTADTDLPSGITVAANENIINLEASTHRDAFTTINRDSTRRYDKVVATGARVGGIGTFALADESIDEDWLSGDQDAYKTGDPNVNTDADLGRQRDDHDRFRRQKYPQVFTRFAVPYEWDGRVGDGEGGVGEELFPGQDLYVAGMRFSSYLPLKIGWDYQSIQPEPTISAPEVEEFRKPFSAFKITDDRWEFGDQLGNVIDETAGANGYDFSCRVHPLDKRFGMSVTPTTVPHALAAGVAEPITEDTSDHEPTLDFEQMLITAYTQSHDYAKAEYPADPDGIILPVDTHYLRLGETAFVDYMPAGTVVDILGGMLVRTRNGMYVRDDREYLQDVARVAWQWYGFDRIASQIRYNQITGNVLRGWMIGELDDVSANAIVTSVLWDFQRQTTEIYTHFAEPDFAELAAR